MNSLFPSSAITAIATIAISSSVLSAQITSGSLGGVVVDDTGQPVTNATVSITFVPTGQNILTRSHDDGRFAASNLRPGGPYTVKVLSIGFSPVTTNDLRVQLGGQTAGQIGRAHV